MEERNDGLSVRVHAAQVRAFVAIAAMTRPREVLRAGRPAVLARDDVFEVKLFEGWKPIRQVTILASPAGPLTNGSAQRLAHFAGAAEASWRSAFKRSVAMISPSSMKRSYSFASSGVSWPSLALSASKSSRLLATSLRCNSPSACTLCESRQRATDSSRLSSTPSSVGPCDMARRWPGAAAPVKKLYPHSAPHSSWRRAERAGRTAWCPSAIAHTSCGSARSDIRGRRGARLPA